MKRQFTVEEICEVIEELGEPHNIYAVVAVLEARAERDAAKTPKRVTENERLRRALDEYGETERARNKNGHYADLDDEEAAEVQGWQNCLGSLRAAMEETSDE